MFSFTAIFTPLIAAYCSLHYNIAYNIDYITEITISQRLYRPYKLDPAYRRPQSAGRWQSNSSSPMPTTNHEETSGMFAQTYLTVPAEVWSTISEGNHAEDKFKKNYVYCVLARCLL
jgi:hypothetical protein